MTEFAFTPAPVPSVEIAGSRQRLPVHRIYCIGRNYADHAVEMGAVPEKSTPFFFTKAPDAVVPNVDTANLSGALRLYESEILR